MCPCQGGKTYESCCKRYHEGELSSDALTLMRSRYSAYALGLSDYIIRTTDPNNPQFQSDKKEWKKQIEQFSKSTEFVNLEILNFTEGKKRAEVTFRAYLKQNGRDASFTERSRFFKSNGRWLYLKGEILNCT